MHELKKHYPWLRNDDPYPWAIYGGWNRLINQMLAAIDIEMLKHSGVVPTVRQVKEKMGGLRFYYSLSDKAPDALHQSIQEFYRQAENLSWTTCEECGESGQLRVSGGCYLVHCDKHAPKRSKVVKGNS